MGVQGQVCIRFSYVQFTWSLGLAWIFEAGLRNVRVTMLQGVVSAATSQNRRGMRGAACGLRAQLQLRQCMPTVHLPGLARKPAMPQRE